MCCVARGTYVLQRLTSHRAHASLCVPAIEAILLVVYNQEVRDRAAAVASPHRSAREHVLRSLGQVRCYQSRLAVGECPLVTHSVLTCDASAQASVFHEGTEPNAAKSFPHTRTFAEAELAGQCGVLCLGAARSRAGTGSHLRVRALPQSCQA